MQNLSYSTATIRPNFLRRVSSLKELNACHEKTPLVVLGVYVIQDELNEITKEYGHLAEKLSQPQKVTFAVCSARSFKYISPEFKAKRFPATLIFKSEELELAAEGLLERGYQGETGSSRLLEDLEGLLRAADCQPYDWNNIWRGVEKPHNLCDLTPLILKNQFEIKNTGSCSTDQAVVLSPKAPRSESRKTSPEEQSIGSLEGNDWVESECDHQMLLFVRFQANVKVESIQITSILVEPDDEQDIDEEGLPSRPRLIKIFVNQGGILQFEDAENLEPTLTADLSPTDWRTDTSTAVINTRGPKFRCINSLCLFVLESERPGAERTRLDRLRIIGKANPGEATKQDMDRWMKPMRRVPEARYASGSGKRSQLHPKAPRFDLSKADDDLQAKVALLIQMRYDMCDDIEEAGKRVVPRADARAWATQLRFIVDRRDNGDCDFEFELIEPVGEAAPEPYVAVSYCWPARGTVVEKPENPIRIRVRSEREPGGYEVRDIKVKWDILSRGFKFAKTHGISRVWIDQECVNQDDRTDKMLGIQSMDLVYRRAKFILAILDHHMQTSEALDMMAEQYYGPHGFWEGQNAHGGWREVQNRTHRYGRPEEDVLLTAGDALTKEGRNKKQAGGLFLELIQELEGCRTPEAEFNRQDFSKRMETIMALSGMSTDKSTPKEKERDEQSYRPPSAFSLFPPDKAEGLQPLADETIDAIMSDRWWTRAWVGQEFLVSNPNELRIMVGCGKGLEEKWKSLKDRYEYFAQFQRVADEWVFTLQELVSFSSHNPKLTGLTFVPYALKMMSSEARVRTHTLIELDPKQPDWSTWSQSPGDGTAALHPLYLDSPCSSIMPNMMYKNCKREDDKISIVENLANWNWGHQEETPEIRKLPLSCRLLALSLYNGDLSPLFPIGRPDPRLLPTWLPSFSKPAIAQGTLSCHGRHERGSRSIVQGGKLLVEGLLWKITSVDDIDIGKHLGLASSIVKWHHDPYADAPHGMLKQEHEDCFVEILRALFDLGFDDVAELILMLTRKYAFATPDSITQHMRYLKTWVRGNMKELIYTRYHTDIISHICCDIAAGMPIKIARCDGGTSMLIGLHHMPNPATREIFTPLSYLATGYAGYAGETLTPGPPIWYVNSSTYSRPTVQEVQKAKQALERQEARGARKEDPNFVSDKILTVVDVDMGSPFIISPRLSSVGMLHKASETGDWKITPLGKEAAYYFFE